MSIRQEDRGLTLRLFVTREQALACFGASTAVPYACGWIARTDHYRWADASGALPADWDPSPELLEGAAAAAWPATPPLRDDTAPTPIVLRRPLPEHFRGVDAIGTPPAGGDTSPELLGGTDVAPATPPFRDDMSPPPTAHPRPPRTNTPIEVLLRGYEAEKCDHSDLEWVSRTALHYAARMPDSQVRCLLHVLATHVHQSVQPNPPIPCNPADTAEPPKGE